ncbi:MAG: hypothetical protein HGA39_05545 [Coriobacteriia bacterium]|nr:hypothetical protein [Coriobacteriia bacterium]
MDKSFKLVPAEVPSKSTRGASVYSTIVDEFMKSSNASVRVEIAGVKAITAVVALRKVAKDKALGMSVVQRGGQIYLQKK